jgi:hypothetical protein
MLARIATEILNEIPDETEIIIQWYTKAHVELNAGLELGSLTSEQWEKIVDKAEHHIMEIWHDVTATLTTIAKEDS